ncbi:S24 family peptidase [Streptococcus pluranimalium]|uniref:S24 family peptidase n=1 Tax=Streptococcus pluranimalium TaxID=82348 RepID=UPI003F690278
MELKEYVGNQIKSFRKSKKMTQSELAKLLDTTKQTISRYEKGERKANQDMLFKLCDIFSVTIDDFFPQKQQEVSSPTPQVLHLDRELKEPRHAEWISYGDKLLDQQNTVENSKDTVDEPVTYYTYNYYDQPASAGTGQYLNDVQVETIELPVDVNAEFVVPIYGDSMEPDYSSGDYIFVKPSVNLSDGDIGVFEYYGDAYIKQLLINKSGAFLHSLNKNYDDIPIDADSDFRIIGEVVGKHSEK